MDASFSFDVDPARNLVRTRLSGFFIPEALDAYVVARRQAFARLRCPVRQHLALTDITGLKIQSQDTVAAFREVLADPKTQAHRLAFVVGSTLARSQLRRALGNRAAACFTHADAAERWLLAPETTALPALPPAGRAGGAMAGA